MMSEIPSIDFKAGQSYRACVPFFGYNKGNAGKIHIVQVIDEGYGQVIVYRAFGQHKQWWHYFIESKEMLEMYIHKFQRTKDENIR